MTDATHSPSDPLHVVLLCTPARVGGLERVVQALARGLHGRGHRVTLVAVVPSAPDAEPLFAPLAGTGVQLVAKSFGARDYRRERREIRALLARLSPDVVHTHGYRCDLLHGGPARRAGIATVSTVHGSSRMGGLSHLFEWLQLRALRAFDAVVPVSSPLHDSLRGVGVRADRLHLVPNAVSSRPVVLSRSAARSALAVPADTAAVVGWVGRLVPVKGADVFLEALARLQATGWLAAIVGDGPERAAMEALAARLGLTDRVRFVGEVDDAARVLPAFDVFALSSRSEGTPIAVLEAMQAGVPVVATAVGGVPALMGGERSGWLVPPESPAALAAALSAALDDVVEAARRGAAGRERVREEYDPERWVLRYEDVYRSAMAHRRGAT